MHGSGRAAAGVLQSAGFVTTEHAAPKAVNYRKESEAMSDDGLGELKVGVLPQVGAILHLNTALPVENPERGSEFWELDGSCVLIDSDRILTLRHTLEKSSRAAVFLPHEGILDLDLSEPPRSDHRVWGDNVVLVPFWKPVRHTAPLSPKKVKKRGQKHASITGYGRWFSPRVEVEDGVQRQARVALHPPWGDRRHQYHYDNLDLCWWSSRNGGLAAGLNNSGGPMLSAAHADSPAPWSVVGLSRQVNGDQQIGSWITNQRIQWIRDEIRWVKKGVPPTPTEPPMASEVQLLNVAAGAGCAVSIAIPEGARRVAATLAATDGIRLQMGITFETAPARIKAALAAWAGSDENSGRFLWRSAAIPEGASQATIGVVRVARSVTNVKSVQAQLCCTYFE